MAREKGANIINLRRLDKLLRGQLTFGQLKDEDKLTSESFKGSDYKPAGTPLTSSETTGGTASENASTGGDASST